jgi:hypothetical protein
MCELETHRGVLREFVVKKSLREERMHPMFASEVSKNMGVTVC